MEKTPPASAPHSRMVAMVINKDMQAFVMAASVFHINAFRKFDLFIMESNVIGRLSDFPSGWRPF